MAGYQIEKIHYRNIYGKLLWENPMIFKRLHAVGELFIENSVEYIVRRVAVADNIQHVNIEKSNKQINPDRLHGRLSERYALIIKEI